MRVMPLRYDFPGPAIFRSVVAMPYGLILAARPGNVNSYGLGMAMSFGQGGVE